MKYTFLLLSLFLPLHVFACKCAAEPNIKDSFENASLVFIGEIYDVSEVPNGFKTSQNTMSKVKINTIYKADQFEDFYNKNATLFHSPLRSCDILYAEKGKYLIFAHIDQDTGLLYSEHCFVQKRLDQVTQEELKELHKLNNDYLTQLKTPNTPTITADLIDEDINVSENMIGKHMKELSDIRSENKTLKKIAVFFLIVILILLIIVLLLRKRISLLKIEIKN
ncbi:hypothetical protein H5J24_01415 [Chryseobacterium capnotolerans]|uniref:hypothetical protein n=1 Tax=Chryseobacterium TaxID=59732 RepID=UPI00083AA414|nr:MULTISPECIES: hypothetical protein [Chryseobacterium]UHO38873.1 hypothetical protein H5J24_01415 [Chryseobacterium capnotolerans]